MYVCICIFGLDYLCCVALLENMMNPEACVVHC